LVLGLLLSILGGSSEMTCGAVMALASGASLLLAGRAGLTSDAPSRFSPIAYRGSLMLALIMAMADAEVLLLWGGLALEQNYHCSVGEVGALFACSAAMIVAVYGLYSLKVWGLALNIAANIVIAVLAVTRSIPIPRDGEWGLVATAAVQLVLPIPLLVAFFRKTKPRPLRTSSWRYLVASAVVVVLMVVAGASALTRSM
jgi:hypothetical protein